MKRIVYFCGLSSSQIGSEELFSDFDKLVVQHWLYKEAFVKKKKRKGYTCRLIASLE